MPALVVELTKLSDREHRFAYRRPDGTGESLTLETRTFLPHDLLHFAVESEAGLKASFYGLLARAQAYADLSGADRTVPGEAGTTEMVVGAMTGMIKGADPAGAVAGARDWMEAQGREVPAWLTPAFAEAVKERFRRLMGEWKATPFGATMTLRFEL